MISRRWFCETAGLDCTLCPEKGEWVFGLGWLLCYARGQKRHLPLKTYYLNRQDMTASSCLFFTKISAKKIVWKQITKKKQLSPSIKKSTKRHFKDWRAGLAGRKGALGFLGGLLLVILYIFTKDGMDGFGCWKFHLDVFFFGSPPRMSHQEWVGLSM